MMLSCFSLNSMVLDKHSTEFVTLELVNRFVKKTGKNDIFLDLSKAFITTDHTILLNILKHVGTNITVYYFFKLLK